MNVGAHTAIPHPPDHPLIATVCMLRVGRTLLAAAATFTRNLESNLIHEEATLPRICNPRAGMPLNTKNSMFGKKVPGDLLLALTGTGHVDFLVATHLCSLTGESMNFGSGVVMNICWLR
jgi:hypothetical protein